MIAALPRVFLLSPMFVVGSVWAAVETAPDHSVSTFILQLVLLLTCGRLLGEVMQRIGQPAVMGQLVAGIVLGPSLFGLLAPELREVVFPAVEVQEKMLDAVSQLGILLLLLVTGMETDLSIVKKVKRAATAVSVSGIVIPFALGFTAGEFMPESVLPDPEQRLITSLFLGTALSIASVKIVATVVREMNFMRRDVGQVIIASAIIDDTIGWILIAIIFGIAIHGRVELLAVAQSVFGTVLFLLFSFTIGRRIVHYLIRWANDTLKIEFAAITAILVIMGVWALITDWLGVHTILGAFVAGMLVGQSPILTRHIEEQLRGIITALFMPVFFAVAGLSADLTILANPTIALLSLGFILIASIGKFSGAFLGSRLGGMTTGEGIALAFGMNARGSTEVIVAAIGLSMGVLSQDLYTMIVTMAIVTTMAMPPSLRWALNRLPLTDEEKERLENDEADAKGFVPNLERVLIVADDSSNGKFAAHLGGLFAGSRRLATTVLPISDVAVATDQHEGKPEDWAALVERSGANERLAVDKDKDDDKRKWVVETAGVKGDIPLEEAVAEKEDRGHDFLILGIDGVANDNDGTLSMMANQVADSFAATLSVVSTGGKHLATPNALPLSILIPFDGSRYSSNGAEIGFAIARAANVQPTVLYISTAVEPGNAWLKRWGTIQLTSQEQGILRDLVSLGEQFGITANMVSEHHRDPAQAILACARRSRTDLIVMGVNRHSGDALFFGHTAAAVLAQTEYSVMLLAS